MSILWQMLSVLGVAAAPVIERGALPLALNFFKLNPLLAFVLVVVGNVLPTIIIIYAFDPILNWLGRYIPLVHRFVHRALAHVREKVHPWIERFGVPGLIIVVAIPTPLTGGYTGAGGAAILGMDKRKALIAVIIGVVIADLIILGADLGILKAIHWFNGFNGR